MAHLKVGDRVEQPDVVIATAHGTVEYADDHYIRVKWDDGQIGVCRYDERAIGNARRLIRLPRRMTKP
jgi:hypothetical protein